MAFEAIESVRSVTPRFSIKPLGIQLPLLPTGQVDSAFINLVKPEDEVTALIITQRDLGGMGLNFCFGRALFNGRAAIVSTNRVGAATLFGLTLHELGHSAGLVAECSTQYDRVSSFAEHCANTCVMEPVNTLNAMDKAVDKYMDSKLTFGFCDPCVSDLTN